MLFYLSLLSDDTDNCSNEKYSPFMRKSEKIGVVFISMSGEVATQQHWIFICVLSLAWDDKVIIKLDYLERPGETWCV